MLPSDDPEDADPGLARERTRLAWTRTAIAFGAVGVALLRREVVPGVIVLAATPLVYAAGRFASRSPGAGPRPGRLLVVTVTVTAVAVLAVIAALLGHGPTSLRQLLHF
jgi:uncharacterized membrane protein YidH (DUF202 family)